jgi:hypothetical protein
MVQYLASRCGIALADRYEEAREGNVSISRSREIDPQGFSECDSEYGRQMREASAIVRRWLNKFSECDSGSCGQMRREPAIVRRGFNISQAADGKALADRPNDPGRRIKLGEVIVVLIWQQAALW